MISGPNRRQAVAVLAACALVLTLAASARAADDKNKNIGRLLHGKVLDGKDDPLVNAVVYLTNVRTRTVKTYIVSQDGTYRFPALSSSVDYEVYAQYNGHRSDTKSVSQFDDRLDVYINLRIH